MTETEATSDSRRIQGLAVLSKRCSECLFSRARIVGDERALELVEQCLHDETYFVCHKASMQHTEAVCRGFYDEHDTRILQIAKRLGVVTFVTEEQLPLCPKRESKEDEE